MKIRWVLKLGRPMVSLCGKTVGLLLYNPMTNSQDLDMVGSGCGP